MKRRLFIAISFPEKVVDEIERETNALKIRFTESIRFSPREQLHMTLVFLGDQDEEKISDIRETMDTIVGESQKKALILDDITYGPIHEHEPRMIWLNAATPTSTHLGAIKQRLIHELDTRGVHMNFDSPTFHGHVTLARFSNLSVETQLPLLIHGGIVCNEYTIDLFSSVPTPMGSEYTLLYSIACAI